MATTQLTPDFTMQHPLFSLNISDYQQFNYKCNVDESSHFEFKLEYLFYKSF